MMRRDMITDHDIYQIASGMLQRYGRSASTYVEFEAEKLLDEADESRFRTWLRTLIAMEELQEAPAGATVH